MFAYVTDSSSLVMLSETKTCSAIASVSSGMVVPEYAKNAPSALSESSWLFFAVARFVILKVITISSTSSTIFAVSKLNAKSPTLNVVPLRTKTGSPTTSPSFKPEIVIWISTGALTALMVIEPLIVFWVGAIANTPTPSIAMQAINNKTLGKTFNFFICFLLYFIF